MAASNGDARNTGADLLEGGSGLLGGQESRSSSRELAGSSGKLPNVCCWMPGGIPSVPGVRGWAGQ